MTMLRPIVLLMLVAASWYPGDRAYNDVCRELVTKYEFLKDHYTANECCFHSWVTRLRNKFKKYRSRSAELTSSADIQRMKQKYGHKRKSVETAVSIDNSSNEPPPVVKMQRVLDILQPPEDEMSVDAHLQALQRECEMATPSSVIIAEKMARTLSHRLKMVSEKSVVDVLASYPSLRIEKEILSEGETTYKVHAANLRTFLQRNMEKLRKAATGRQAKLLLEVYQKQEQTEASDEIYSALLVSLCLREQSLFYETSQPTLYPYILYSGDENIFGTLTVFRTFADGVEVTSCRDVVTALTTTFLMFWIFDIKYPKTSISMLSLFSG